MDSSKADLEPFNHYGHSIFLLNQDAEVNQQLVSQLSYFGYEILQFGSVEDIVKALHSGRPAPVLITLTAGDDPETRFAEVAFLHEHLVQRQPILIIAENGALTFRLQAVRAGAVGYFVLPLDTASLVEVLERLSNSEKPTPFHILIVEDSMTQASLFAMHLKHAGMITRVVSDPMQIFAHLQDFIPDLILMDIYMPGCTGMELAQVIRQMENFVSVPIVYLSAETDIERQLEALGQGADDFLTKPIVPAHLISAINSRVERYRRLRSLMMFDGLTSLLNHTTTKENLAREFLRTRRENIPLSFAMLDLDHFKQVNDQFGHAVGDRVLKSLARLLRQRLRRTDIIGRYGGEEFAVILPNTRPDVAFRLMDDLRTSFAEILHRSDESDFSVTFSCGIAGFPAFSDLSELSSSADRALYKAKQNGRNQVCLSSRETAPLRPDLDVDP
jgi:diguanylate cyclase (GGDEF)-like protein